MKKLLVLMITIGLFFALIPNSSGALQNDTVWEVRTTGNAANGGAFDKGGSGTDYSQQDAAQLSLTDLAQTDASTTLTSVIGGFTSVMVDNIIQIQDDDPNNFEGGFYEITAYTNGNTVTIDRTATDGDGDATSGSGKVGGALSKPSEITHPLETDNTVYLKSGTYTDTWTLDFSGNFKNLLIIGYNATRGDTPTGDNRPVINGGANNYTINLGADTSIDTCWANIRFTGSTVAVIYAPANVDPRFYNCKLYSGSGDGIIDDSVDRVYRFVRTEITGMADDGLNLDSGRYSFNYSYIHDNSGDGQINSRASSGSSFVKTIFDTNGGYGVADLVRVGKFEGNIFYNNTLDGMQSSLDADNPTYPEHFMGLKINNVFHDNGEFGFDNTTASYDKSTWDYNAYEGNTSGGLDGITAGSHDVTNDPLFTNAVAGDFTVQAGSPLISVGWPDDTLDEWIGTASGVTYKTHIGIDQDDNAAAGGGTGFFSIF